MNIEDDADILVGYVATALDNKAWDKARAKIIEYLYKYNGVHSEYFGNKYTEKCQENLRLHSTITQLEKKNNYFETIAADRLKNATELQKQNTELTELTERRSDLLLKAEAKNDKLDGLNMALDLENKEQQKIINKLNEKLN